MFARLSNSWELVKASWSVLRSDKELIVFPIVSSLAAIIVSILFAVPSIAAGLFDNLSSGRGNVTGPVGYVVAFLFYLVLYSVIFYFNTALVGAALIRLRGGDPTLRDGLRIASERTGTILGYALLSATVGLVLRFISERAGLLGQIASGLVGLAWNVATFLTVPVLVIEDVGPLEAVRRSTALLKRTWGEQIVGNFSIGTIFGLAMVGVLFLMALLVAMALSIEANTLAVLFIVVTVIVLIVLGLISSALSGIFQAALYRYATDGDTAGYFDPALIQGAFREKNKRR